MIERFDVREVRDNETHRKFAAEHRRRYELAREFLLHQLGRGNVRVVDAACGCGYGYEYLEDLGRYVGLDASEEAVAECQGRYPGASFYVCDLEGAEPFGKLGGVNAVVSLETAEHLDEPLDFLMATGDLLAKTDGVFAFSVPTGLTRDFDPYHKHDRDAGSWRWLLEAVGFEVVREIPMAFETPFLDFLRTVPTTWRQKLRVAAFNLVHWQYAIDRIRNWVIRGQFCWESTLFLCRLKASTAPATPPVRGRNLRVDAGHEIAGPITFTGCVCGPPATSQFDVAAELPKDDDDDENTPVS